MTILRSTRIYCAVLILLFGAGCIDGNGHDGKGVKALQPPTDIERPVFPFGETLTPTSAIIRWKISPGATSYIIAIFKVENKELILHQEIKNVKKQPLELGGLEPSTTYEITMQSVRVHLDGTTDTSDYSKPYSFRTLDACKGGMVHVACTAHCIPTCERQRPACDRRCVSGCSCPRDMPFLHDGKCIGKKDCKDVGAPLTEVISRPSDLKLHRMKGSNDLLFTWNEVEGADYYTVIVMTQDREVVQTIDDIKIPLVIIKGLKPRVRYRFKVQAKFFKFDPSQRRHFAFVVLKPTPPTIAQITDSSFYAQWEEYPNAETYKLVIFDPDAKEILHVFKNLKETYITIQGLSPGTSYDVSLIAVTASDEEVESDIVSVQTEGNREDEREIDPTEITHVIEPLTTTTTVAPSTTAYVPTCRDRKHALEAYMDSDPDFDGHIPDCDGSGNYRTRQCEKRKRCYCVTRRSGEERPGSAFDNTSSEFALECSRYGQFRIDPIPVNATALNSTTIRVRWIKNTEASFYIVKVYNGFEGGLATYVSGITRNVANVDGLSKGSPYVVIVIGVDDKGRTSSDRVKGAFVSTPHLDPPTNIKLTQVDKDRMKVSWTKNDVALHYQVEIDQKDNDNVEIHENVTEDYLIFRVSGSELYRVSVKANGLTSIPGSGQTVLVSSNAVTVAKRPSCVFPAMDIIYVIDISTKMSTEDYDKAKRFFTLLTQSLSPMSTSVKDPVGTRFAAVKAYDVAREIFRFSKHERLSNVNGAIRFARQSRSPRLNFGRALDFVYQNFFKSPKNSDQRKNVATAVISFIGGPSNDNDYALEAATLRSVTNVITVAVENREVEEDLRQASPENFRVRIPSYDAVEQAFEEVMAILCNLK